MAGAYTDLATSSSSSAWPHDVFISFRGEEVRIGLLSHIRNAFQHREIKVFVDENISKGEEVWPALEKAIIDSFVSVVIFSKSYASSTWCLRELRQILICMKKDKQVVIPVFYGVEPSHVRKQTGTYKTAFAKHERDFKQELLLEWRRCLTEAGSLAGWDSKTYRSEAELTKQITDDVWQKLRDRQTSTNKFEGRTNKFEGRTNKFGGRTNNFGGRTFNFEGLMGMEERYGRVKSRLQDSSIEILGIWGMPGMGKTTLANVAFSKLSREYEGSCFLSNVRELSEKHGIDCLRWKLFHELLDDMDLDIDSAKLGNSLFINPSDYLRRLSWKKVLIVLDDVNSTQQIDSLVGPDTLLGPGSRVIITSRHRIVLKGRVDDIFEVTALNPQQSLQLFCSKAFNKTHPIKGYKEVTQRAVSIANGCPLALNVLGSLPYSESPSGSNTKLERLQRFSNLKIQDALELSYEELDELHRNIFLDIACLWKGEDKADLIKALDDLYDIDFAERAVNTLQDKVLIIILDVIKVWMHDLIQEMGREIVRKENASNPGGRSRLWNVDDIYYVLTNERGTKAVKSIILNVSQCRHMNLSPYVFGTMPNVKYLKFYTSFESDSCNLDLPSGLNSLPNLRFLQWDGYRSEYLPSTFSAENLVELRISNGQVKKLWDGVQDLANLKTVNLSSCKKLTELPDLSRASKLEIMHLSFCSSLIEISSWLKYLNELRNLNLEFCRNLERLPRNVHLLSLEEVNCGGCSNLKEFSLTSDKMIFLSLKETAIERLPTQIWSLNKLETLILSSCTRFESLPNSPTLVELPNFDGLWSLERPKKDVPWNLSSLQDLYLNETNIESLPVSIKDLGCLKGLTLKKCDRLRSIPELPLCLSYLCATDCVSVKAVANSKSDQMKKRQALYYYNCKDLDQSSRNNIIVDAQFRIRQTDSWRRELSHYHDQMSASVSICLPGKDIPGWFTYQNLKSSLVCKIPASWSASIFLGFALCLVLGEFPENYDDYEEINLQCLCKLNNTGKLICASKFEDNYVKYSEDIPRGLNSDHVFMWYNLNFELGAYREEGEEILFDFYGPHDKVDLVRKCGICPLFGR